MLWLVLSAIPAGCLAALICTYAVDVPSLDQWHLVVFFDRQYSGELRLTDLFEQHNEHRPAFPVMLMLVLARISSWSIPYELAATFLLVVASFMVLLILASRSQASFNRHGIRWSACLISLFVFSLGQSGIWLWGWGGIQLSLNLFAVVSGIAFLSMPGFRWYRLAGSLLLGVAATYSYGTGLLYWAVGLPVIVFARAWTRNTRLLATTLWFVVAVLIVLAYFHGYQRPLANPSLTSFTEQPWIYAKYVLALLGNAASGAHPWEYGAAGLALLVATGALLLCVHRVRSQSLLPWLILSLYAIGSAMTIGIGRVGFGYRQALSSRYIILSNLLWVSLVVLLFLLVAVSWDSLRKAGPDALVNRKRIGSGLSLLFSIAVLVTVILPLYENTSSALETFRGHWEWMLPARVALAGLGGPEGQLVQVRRGQRDEFLSIDDALVRLLPEADDVRERAEILRRHHLSVFRSSTDETSADRKARQEYTARVVPAGPIVHGLQRALRDNPDDLQMLHELASISTKAGLHGVAARCYRELVRRNPKGTGAYLRLGESLARAGRSEDAVRVLSRLIQHKPNNRYANLALGRAMLDLGRVEEAATHLEIAARRDAANADASYLLGSALARQGRLFKAQIWLERAIALNPNLAAAYLELGELHLLRDDQVTAETWFAEALRLRPFLPEAHYRLGVLALSNGRHDEAIGRLEKALALDPSHEPSRSALAEARMAEAP